MDLKAILAAETSKTLEEERLKMLKQKIQQERDEAERRQKEAEASVEAYKYFQFFLENLYEPFVANMIINGHQYIKEDMEATNKEDNNERKPIRGSIKICSLDENGFDNFYQRVKNKLGVGGENNDIVNYINAMAYEIDGTELTLTFHHCEDLVDELTNMLEAFISRHNLAIHLGQGQWGIDARFNKMINVLEIEKELKPQMDANVRVLAEEYNIPFEKGNKSF